MGRYFCCSLQYSLLLSLYYMQRAILDFFSHTHINTSAVYLHTYRYVCNGPLHVPLQFLFHLPINFPVDCSTLLRNYFYDMLAYIYEKITAY